MFALALVVPGPAAALTPGQTTNRTIPAVRLSSPPTIDGVLDDPCWKEAATSSGFTDEMLGTPVQDDTTIWLGYDNECIYVAFYAHDSEPSKIVARETKRGSKFFAEDRVRLRVNPFNSKRREDESEINLNALGTQMAEFAGGRADKQEWEGDWKGAARIVADGWTAEMAVPWRCFVRPRTNGKPVTIGINFDRYQARTQIKSYWSNLGPQERREFGGEWVGVVLPPADRVRPLSTLFYSYGGYDRGTAALRMGADLRYQFNPSFTGVFTVNPDFSNVEGAVTSVDFSYAEKLPDERRPFFLEGGDFLSSGMYSLRPFASIRLDRMDLGAKFFGRVGPRTDLGFLATAAGSRRQDAVLTLRHQFSPFDSLLFQGVTRTETGLNNQIGLLVGRIRRGDWTLQAAYARSADTTGPGEGTDIYLAWSARTWFFHANYEQISRNLQARDGYITFLDRKGLDVSGGYWAKWRSGEFRSGMANLELRRFFHLDGSLFYDEVSVTSMLEHRNGLALRAGFSLGTFEENFDRFWWTGITYPAQNKFSNVNLRVSQGRRGGSPYRALSPSFVHRFGNRLSVGLSSEIVEAGERYEQHIFTLSYDFSPDRGIGGRIVQRSGQTNGYLSYRKSGYGGTEYFIILGDPNAETFASRLLLKVVQPL